MDILFVLIIFIFGFALGWIRSANYLLNKIAENPDGIINVLKKYKEESKLETLKVEESRSVKVEKVGNQLYLYDEKTDDFLAQGSTLEEALEQIEKRFPGKKYHGNLSKDQVASLGISVKQ
jgi:hypothetical protein